MATKSGYRSRVGHDLTNIPCVPSLSRIGNLLGMGGFLLLQHRDHSIYLRIIRTVDNRLGNDVRLVGDGFFLCE